MQQRLARQVVSNRAALAGRRAARTKQRRILRLRQVKERTGLSKSTIYKAISEGKFPALYPRGRQGGRLG
jgi:excisionase family DNA binding protein